MGPQALLNWMTKSKINLIIFMALLGCGLIYVVNCDLESSDILHPPDGKGKIVKKDIIEICKQLMLHY